MSTLAVSFVADSGDPVNNQGATATFPTEGGTINAESGVGGALTYFRADFTSGDHDVHQIEARITDLLLDPANNSASGELSAKLNGDDEQAIVTIQAALLVYLQSNA